MPTPSQKFNTVLKDRTDGEPPRKKSPARSATAPTAWPLTPATEAAVQQVAGALQVKPDLVVEVAVAEWCRQQAEALHLTLHSPSR